MRKLTQYGSLFALFFLVTTTFVLLETGNVLAAFKVAALVTPFKWCVSHAHTWWFHGRKRVVRDDFPEYTI